MPSLDLSEIRAAIAASPPLAPAETDPVLRVVEPTASLAAGDLVLVRAVCGGIRSGREEGSFCVSLWGGPEYPQMPIYPSACEPLTEAARAKVEEARVFVPKPFVALPAPDGAENVDPPLWHDLSPEPRDLFDWYDGPICYGVREGGLAAAVVIADAAHGDEARQTRWICAAVPVALWDEKLAAKAPLLDIFRAPDARLYVIDVIESRPRFDARAEASTTCAYRVPLSAIEPLLPTDKALMEPTDDAPS